MQVHTNPIFVCTAPGTPKCVQICAMNAAANFEADGHDTKEMSARARQLLSGLLHPEPAHRASAAALCQSFLRAIDEVPLPACPIQLFL